MSIRLGFLLSTFRAWKWPLEQASTPVLPVEMPREAPPGAYMAAQKNSGRPLPSWMGRSVPSPVEFGVPSARPSCLNIALGHVAYRGTSLRECSTPAGCTRIKMCLWIQGTSACNTGRGVPVVRGKIVISASSEPLAGKKMWQSWACPLRPTLGRFWRHRSTSFPTNRQSKLPLFNNL